MDKIMAWGHEATRLEMLEHHPMPFKELRDANGMDWNQERITSLNLDTGECTIENLVDGEFITKRAVIPIPLKIVWSCSCPMCMRYRKS